MSEPSYLCDRRLWRRLESVGTTFLSTFIQNAARDEGTSPPLDALFDDTIEMMTAAMAASHCGLRRGRDATPCRKTYSRGTMKRRSRDV